jgi:hypothetical protein
MLVGRIRSVTPFSGPVTDPAAPTSFLSLYDTKIFLGIDQADVTQDDFLSVSINVVCAGIERYLDRLVVKRRIVELFPNNSGPLTLTHFPVISVVSIADQYGNVLPSQDVDVMPEQGAVYARDPDRGDLFNGRYVVTYDAGWDLSSVPPQIVQGAKEWVKSLKFERSRDPSIASEEAVDVGRVDYTWGTSSARESQLIAVGRHSGAAPMTTSALINTFKRRLS